MGLLFDELFNLSCKTEECCLLFLGITEANGLVTDEVSQEESSEDVDPDSWEQVGPKKKSVLTRRVCRLH